MQCDNRVHCCLYFLESNSRGMTPLDVEFMRKLHEQVNIIPIISKADAMNPDKITEYKKQVYIITFLYICLKILNESVCVVNMLSVFLKMVIDNEHFFKFNLILKTEKLINWNFVLINV